MRWYGVVAATAALLSVATAVASADPVAPQPNNPCSAANAMTLPPGGNLPLICRDGRWHAATTPQPPSDRWLSYGPEMTLHGQGKRNPNVTSGNWTATPQDPHSRCRAEQSAVVSAGVVGPTQVAESQPGQPLTLQMLPRLFSVELSGYCLWEKAG